MYILGPQQKKRLLSRLTFGRFKVLLTDSEMRDLSAACTRYLDEHGTTFGFAGYLLSHVRS
jgi:hypothetical protein